jgi:hypothetical protein
LRCGSLRLNRLIAGLVFASPVGTSRAVRPWGVGCYARSAGLAHALLPGRACAATPPMRPDALVGMTTAGQAADPHRAGGPTTPIRLHVSGATTNAHTHMESPVRREDLQRHTAPPCSESRTLRERRERQHRDQPGCRDDLRTDAPLHAVRERSRTVALGEALFDRQELHTPAPAPTLGARPRTHTWAKPCLVARTYTLTHHSTGSDGDPKPTHGRSPVWRADPRCSYERSVASRTLRVAARLGRSFLITP